MPLKQKRKGSVCKKGHQTGGKTQDFLSAQAPVSKKKRYPSPSPTNLEVATHTGADCEAQILPELPQSALSTTESKSVSPPRSRKRAKGKIKRKQSSSKASSSTVKHGRSALNSSVCLVVTFMLRMYKMKKPILKADVLKMIGKSNRQHFPEILKRVAFNMEVVFGVDLKEIASAKDSYIFVSKMNLPNNGALSQHKGLPKTGLLMNLLGVILLKGNCATEEMIWDFLNKMKIYDGKSHFIFGEPRKLITQDLVKLKYLEYRQVPNSNPARYEFLWGSRSLAETSKMKILEFLAKINHTVPSAFHSCYNEALKDEEERAKAAVTTGDTLIRSQ
ncbi:melanoma-associated antigen B3 [Nannospalax galili]|uniref:melanoma-associated antigen B3 n=1 Tax=Nannospalax galili TaxID=1026970 RepID=UPI0004ED1904|nr:melanoma-associated antigen B3 [Nannospalax galili]